MLSLNKIKPKKYKKYIKKSNLIGTGTQVYCFKYKSPFVLKLAPKTIGFFESGLSDPKTVINSLYPFFLNINRVLVNNKKYLLYTQRYVNRIKNLGCSRDNIYLVLTVILTIIYMFKKDVLMTDIGIHNWGDYNSNYVIFDWHGIKPVKKTSSSDRLIKNVNKYLSNYFSDITISSNDITKILLTYDYDIINKYFKRIYSDLYAKYHNNLSSKQKYYL